MHEGRRKGMSSRGPTVLWKRPNASGGSRGGHRWGNSSLREERTVWPSLAPIRLRNGLWHSWEGISLRRDGGRELVWGHWALTQPGAEHELGALLDMWQSWAIWLHCSPEAVIGKCLHPNCRTRHKKYWVNVLSNNNNNSCICQIQVQIEQRGICLSRA